MRTSDSPATYGALQMCFDWLIDCAGVKLLATASRDRLVHIFDIDHDYGLVQTLDDHSSAITAVRFTDIDSQLMMLSCGADKSLLFRNAQLVRFMHFSLCLLLDIFLFVYILRYSWCAHTHSVLTAIFPGEPGLAGCPLNSPSPFIPGLCILLGQT